MKLEILYSFFVPMVVAVSLYSVSMFFPKVEKEAVGVGTRIAGGLVAVLSGVASGLVTIFRFSVSPFWALAFLPAFLIGVYLIHIEISLLRKDS